jgi:tetratricopeptide (TPR) repeat protein
MCCLLAACGGEMTPDERLIRLRELVADENFEKALNEVQLLLPKMPTDSAVLMLAGKTYYALQKFDSAHVCAKQYTALYPTRIEGYHLLYATGEELEDYDAQIWCASQLGYLENNKPKYYFDIARLNFLRGEYGMAMRTCHMILENDPRDPNALFILANSLASAGKIDSAVTIMEELNRVTPDRVEVLTNLASFLADKRDYEQSAVHFRRLTSIFPDYLPGWYGLGNVMLNSGDTTAAGEAYWQVYTRDSTFFKVDSIMRSIDPLRIK